MKTIGELCERDVVTCTADTTVAAVAKLMRRHHVGSVVIVDRHDRGLSVPRAIVTDRDIVVAVTALELDASVMAAGDIVPQGVVTARANIDVLEAMQIMRSKGVRRLPVVTEDNHLVGLVAFDDLLELMTEQLYQLTKVVGREQAREAATRK